MAARFIKEGSSVVAFDRDEERLLDLARELGKNARTVRGDVRRREDNEKAVAAAVEAFGRLDIFIGNAGVFDGYRTLKDLAPGELDAGFSEIFDINVRGYLLGAKAALPELIKKRGCMVFTASTAGFRSGGGGPLYTASKHAVVGLIRSLASELAPDVRVNGVAPGGTVTGLRTAEGLGSMQIFSDARVARERLAQSSPLNLACGPDDHAGAYVLLASEHARAITGIVIPSDGGTGVRRSRFQP